MQQTIILGLGNILYADEGIGVRAAEFLYQHYDFTPQIDIVDGGTQGMALLTHVERAERLLLLDAVDFALPPGSVVCKYGAEIPRYLTAQKYSVHQGSFSEVLALADLRGAMPKELVLVGLQPATLTLGAPLSKQAQEQGLPTMVLKALQCLRQWNIEITSFTGQRHLHHPSIGARCFLCQERGGVSAC